MKAKRKTITYRLPKPRPGALTDDQIRQLVMMFAERLNDALETLLRSNLSLTNATESLAKPKLTP